MKKLLLLSAAAMLACSASAQTNESAEAGYTLTRDWGTTENVPSAGWGSYARSAGGYNGVIYINQSGKGLHSFSYDGTTVKHEQNTNVIANGIGPSFDGNGNAIILNSYNTGNEMKQLVLWNSKTGETKTIDITIPEGYTAGKMSWTGRAAGDIWSEEGGAVFMIGGSDANILKVYIAKAEQVVDKTKVIETSATPETYSVAQPLTNDPTKDDVIYRYRTGYDFYYNNGEKWVAYSRPENGKVCSNAGGDVVVLNGVTYTIEPAKFGSITYMDGFQIVERTNNTVVASHKEASTSTIGNKNSYNTSLSVEKISETKANIYQLHPADTEGKGAFVAKYTFTVPDTETAIESVAVDANAPVEYYNLQGVKVANPENGLFIKKQGNKAVKVIL